jgi:hypothetical protein
MSLLLGKQEKFTKVLIYGLIRWFIRLRLDFTLATFSHLFFFFPFVVSKILLSLVNCFVFFCLFVWFFNVLKKKKKKIINLKLRCSLIFFFFFLTLIICKIIVDQL